MKSIENLAKQFDYLVSPVTKVGKPTQESIQKINKHFNIEIPKSMIEFASKSNNYGSWFSSIGEDYESEFHIIRINSLFKKIRRRSGGKWINLKPDNYVVINHGHDEDCDCFDVNTRSTDTGEYTIRYWYPGSTDEYEFGDFPRYVDNLIENWSKDLKGEKQVEFERLKNA